MTARFRMSAADPGIVNRTRDSVVKAFRDYIRAVVWFVRRLRDARRWGIDPTLDSFEWWKEKAVREAEKNDADRAFYSFPPRHVNCRTVIVSLLGPTFKDRIHSAIMQDAFFGSVPRKGVKW